MEILLICVLWSITGMILGGLLGETYYPGTYRRLQRKMKRRAGICLLRLSGDVRLIVGTIFLVFLVLLEAMLSSACFRSSLTRFFTVCIALLGAWFVKPWLIPAGLFASNIIWNAPAVLFQLRRELKEAWS